jgi:O-antigen/teichoic acid export membrane protein
MSWERHSPRLSQNAILTFATQALPMVAGVICLPALIHVLGAERVGLLTMIWIIISYFSVLDLGVGTATTRAASIALAKGDEASIPLIFWSATALQLAMGCVGSLCLIFCAPAVAAGVIKIPLEIRAECILTIRICAVGVPIVLVSGSVTGMLQAASRFRTLAKCQIPFSVAQYVGPVVLALSGGKLPSIVLLIVTLRLAGLIATFAAARRALPALKRRVSVNPKQARSLLSFGFWIMISSIVSPILVYVDRFLIGHRLGLADVAYYSIPLDVVMRLLLFSSSVTTVLYPAFSALSGIGGVSRASTIASVSLKYILCFTGIPSVLLILFADDLLRVWLGPVFAAHSTVVVRILLVGILSNALARVPFSLLQSNGHARTATLIQLVALPLQIISSVILMSSFGVSGAAMAWSGRLLLETVALFWFGRRSCGLSLSQAWEQARVAAYVLTLILCIGSAALMFTATPMVYRAVVAVMVGSGSCGLLWRLALGPEERTMVLGYMKLRQPC